MRYKQRGFSVVELVVVAVIVGIIGAIAIPALRSGHLAVSAPEAKAVREIQMVVRAQKQYRSKFGKYAATLDQLGPGAAALIPASLASPDKEGYQFAMVSTRTGYALLASPRIYVLDGRRTFYVNQDGVVHQNLGERPASADSPVFR
jgi:prepilin-type N-terminal cleavage/methylation domain-containing protein